MSRQLGEFKGGQLVQMVTDGWTSRVVVAIENAIAFSFESDSVLRPVKTQDEIKRRFVICIETFKMLRRDLGWSVPRILDEIPKALRAKLDGIPWEPSDGSRSAWAPDSAPVEMVVDGDDEADPVPLPYGIDVEG